MLEDVEQDEMNDHNLLRKMLKDVEPGWEGHVLSINCEYAEGEGDPDRIDTANRLYALWEGRRWRRGNVGSPRASTPRQRRKGKEGVAE